jgi:Transposase DDE domain
MTSSSKAEGRFGKQDFRYVAEENVYICPAGERLTYHYTNVENGLTVHRYWTNACQSCAIKRGCTTGKERRITRWEHEHILEAVQRRLDEHPEKMRQRRETVEHPFGTIKARMGSNPLPDEDVATRCHRDGTARAGLQSHPCHQHHGRPTAHGGDEGIVVADMRPPAIAGSRNASAICLQEPFKTQRAANPEKWPRTAPCRGRDARASFSRSLFTQPGSKPVKLTPSKYFLVCAESGLPICALMSTRPSTERR